MRTKIGTAVIILFLTIWSFVVIINFISENGQANWSIETVANGGNAAIALDDNGYGHITYCSVEGALKYAKWTGSKWSNETVDNNCEDPSIALDDNGHAHISYSDGTNYALKYANWTGNSWIIKTVYISDYLLDYTSIILDSNDYPHISFHDVNDNDLKYVKWNGSAWNVETVDNTSISVGLFTSIALDGSDYPHISYYDDYNNMDLKYAKWNGSAWNLETVDNDGWVGTYTSIALDSNDYPHISYKDEDNKDLKFAKWNGTTWNIETVDSTGWVGTYTSIALDSNDYAHISYIDINKSDIRVRYLKYAEWDGNSWNIVTIDGTGDADGPTSIALDNNDYVHISYGHGSPSAVNYVKETDAIVPSAPRNLRADAGDSKVTLTWTMPISDGGLPIRNFNIYRSTTSGTEMLLTTVGNVLTYNDIEVINGQTYYYRVSAVNSVGEGEQSIEVSAIPMKPIFEEMWFWIVIMVIIIAIVLIVVLVLIRKRGRKPIESVPLQPPPLSPPPPQM